MKFLRFIFNFIAVILMVFMFVFMLVFNVCDVCLKLITPNEITKTLEKVDVNALLVDNDGSKMEIYQYLVDNVGISENEINDLLNSGSFKNMMGDLLGSILSYSLTGDEDSKVSSSFFNSMISDNIDTIIKEAKISLTSAEKDKLLREITSNSEEVVSSLYDNVEVINNSKNIKLIVDNYLLIIVLITVLLFLLIALFRWSFIQAISDFGIVTLISGIVTSLVGLLVGNSFVLDYLRDNYFEFINLLKAFISSISNLLFINGIIMLFVGILLIVIFSVLKKIRRKRKMMIVNNFNENISTLNQDNEKELISDDNSLVKNEQVVSEDTMEMKTFADKVDE